MRIPIISRLIALLQGRDPKTGHKYNAYLREKSPEKREVQPSSESTKPEASSK